MDGRTILGAWAIRSPGRVAVGPANLLNFISSGIACSPEGWATRFMPRLGFLPRAVRGIAPAVVTPQAGRRIFFEESH